MPNGYMQQSNVITSNYRRINNKDGLRIASYKAVRNLPPEYRKDMQSCSTLKGAAIAWVISVNSGISFEDMWKAYRMAIGLPN